MVDDVLSAGKQCAYTLAWCAAIACAPAAWAQGSVCKYIDADGNIVFSNLQRDMFRRFLRQSDTKEKITELLDEADQGK